MKLFRIRSEKRSAVPSAGASESSAEPPNGPTASSKSSKEPFRSFLSWGRGKHVDRDRSPSESPTKFHDRHVPSRPRTQDHLPSNFTSALQAAKDLGEMAENFPYIKAVAGLSLTLLKMWEEVQQLDELAGELLGIVSDRILVLSQVAESIPAAESRQMQNLEKDLMRYEELLQRIKSQVATFSTLQAHQRTLQRAKIRESFERALRELHHFDQLFTMARLSDLTTVVSELRQTALVAPSNVDTMYEDPLPPAPSIFLGRESEISAMVNLCTSCPNPRVVILGMGGMGKTTLARAVLNEATVLSAFTQALFVSCEQVTTLTGILTRMANVLEIPVHERGQALRKNVIAQLRSASTLLCLDNFEDPWEAQDAWSEFGGLLQLLGGMPRLGLLLTMRGSARPHGVDWTHPRPEPLMPLKDYPALQLFRRVSGVTSEDKRIRKLLDQVENYPLAIELLARQIDPPHDNFDAVLQRWEKQGLRMLDRRDHSDGRLTSVTKSIELSLQSPRIVKVPHIHDVLRMVTVLPEGLAESTIPRLQSRLPSHIDLSHGLRELVQTSLCYRDSKGRYRVLGPIRQHVEQSLPLQTEHYDALLNTFMEIVDADDTSEHDTVAPELGNVRIFFSTARVPWGDDLIGACQSYLWWENHVLGTSNVQLAEEALSHAQDPDLMAWCLTTITRLLLHTCQYDEAERALQPALQFQTGSLYRDGDVRYWMGHVLFRLQKFEEAESSLRKAEDLFRRSNQIKWEGSALDVQGALCLEKGHFSDARPMFEKSLQLARAVNEPLHEGDPLRNLGTLCRLTRQTQEAEEFCRLAIKCAQTSHCVLDEGLARCALGDVYRTMNRLKEAEECYLDAQELGKQARHLDGVAGALQGLGQVYSRMEDRGDSALKYFQEALTIYPGTRNSEQQAITHIHLGRFLLLQKRHAEAFLNYVIALAFHLQRLHRSKQRYVPGICIRIQHALGCSSS